MEIRDRGRIRAALYPFVVSAGLVLLAGSAAAVQLPGAAGDGVVYLPDQLVVKYGKGLTRAAQATALSRASAQEVRQLRHVGLSVIQTDRTRAGLARALERLGEDPAVEWVEKVPLAFCQFVPPDPQFAEQWPLHNTGQTGGAPDADIDAVEAWDLEDGSGHPVVVAVIDSGVDYTHPDLAANIWTNPGEDPWADPLDPSTGNGLDDDGNGLVDDWKGWDYVGGNLLFPAPDNDPRDMFGHGTHVAGIIGAASNAEGGVGVNFYARILPVKIGDDSQLLNSLKAIEAIDYLIDLKTRPVAPEPDLRIINASWAQLIPLQAMQTAIEAAGAAGILFVCAAGNGGEDSVGDDIDNPPLLQGSWPAAFDSATIVSVAATNHSDNLAAFSNYGLKGVDLGAPGVACFGTLPTYDVVMTTQYGYSLNYDFLSGTSMATPCVAGAAALLLAGDPSLTPCEVKSLLLEQTDPVSSLAGKTVTGGRLNLARGIAADPVDTDGDGEVDVCDDDDDDDGCPDELDPERTAWSGDADGDQYGADCDCNEADPFVNPGMTEVQGNGIDDDCDPATPDSLWTAATRAEASTGGTPSLGISARVNHAAALGLSMAAVLGMRLALRRARRRRWRDDSEGSL